MTSLSADWWARVLTDGSGGVRSSGEWGDEHYVLLPNSKDPRVVVDSESRPAIDDAVLRFAASRSVPRSLAGFLSRSASPILTRRSGWAVSAGTGQTLKVALSELLETEVRLSVAVGPPRPNRKPVVRCWVGSELVAIAKLGPDPHTAAMVRNEAVWLQRLQHDPIAGVVTPEPIHMGEWGGGALLVMKVLPLVDGSPELPVGDLPMSVVEELAGRLGDSDDSPATMKSAWWPSLLLRLAGSADPVVRQAVAAVQLDPQRGSLALGMWHGDWSPWNVGRLVDGRWGIWDWERASLNAPVGFDLLHLHYQYGAGMGAADPAIAALGVPDAHTLMLRRLYLLELVARHIEADATNTARHDQVRKLMIDDASATSAAELHGNS